MDFETFKAKMKLNEIKLEEFLQIILQSFNGVSFQNLPGKYVFHSFGDVVLALNLDRNSNIVSIESNAAPEIFDKIAQTVQETLVNNQTEKIGQAVLFSINVKVNGVFRHKDQFQILPIPTNAPRINQLAGEHPFLLEYKYISTPNSGIDNARRLFQMMLIAKRLNLFTVGAISYNLPFIYREWVIEGTVEPDTLTSRYAQKGYYWREYQGIVDQFSDTTQTPLIPLIKSNEYMDYKGFERGVSDFQLPDNLSASFEKIAQLSHEDLMKFDLACSWIYHSKKVWPESQSLSYIALNSAVESLFEDYDKCPKCFAPTQEAFDTCPVCGLPMFKITKTLREFLDEYSPIIKDMPNERKKMYNTRSSLAHGLSMFSRDLEPGMLLKPIQQDQDHLHRNINYIVFLAIYNWLWRND